MTLSIRPFLVMPFLCKPIHLTPKPDDSPRVSREYVATATAYVEEFLLYLVSPWRTLAHRTGTMMLLPFLSQQISVETGRTLRPPSCILGKSCWIVVAR
jgi:hypothetical protein